jgi:hypothetical protein
MAQQQQNTATPARPPEPYSLQNSSAAPFMDQSRSNTVISESAPLMYNSGATSSFRSADMESQRQPYSFIPTESVRSGLVKTYGSGSGSNTAESEYGLLRIGREHATSYAPQPVEPTFTQESFDRPMPPATTMMMMGGTNGSLALPPPPPPQPTMPLPPPPPFNPNAARPPLVPTTSRPILSYPNLPIDDGGSAAYGGIPAPM